MNLLDLVLLTMALLAGIGGYRLGFLTRVLSWVGMAVGLWLGARSLPWLFRQLPDQPPSTLLLIAAGTLLGASFLGQGVGVMAGSRMSVRLPNEDWKEVDRVFGGLAGILGVVVALWFLLPTLGDVPGYASEQARNSVLARFVDRTFPDPPDTLVALRRLVGEDQFPRVFDALTPAPDLGPPPGDAGLPDDVVARVIPSTVKISGIACRRVQEGSGFVVAGTDVVVTNAHVVAGQDDTQIERDDGQVLDAFVAAFDPNRDLAVLRVPGLERAPLPIADGSEGTTGGVFGRPGGAPLRIAPFQVGDQVSAAGTDIYDRSRTEREVLILASSLRPGDSGAALIDANGAVVGVAFAIAPDDPGVAYALDITELQAVLQGDLTAEVDTGPCLR